ncbi:Anti-sigma-K factor RskA [Sphingomonas sp. NFR04]|uniref:anti-sigma factor domain-containing protein n=1 Tax=Sphingomonas sp. NFR04 TaxID=1566283 RepID=UPI0008F0B989|nr:anti-sigma factor [Sphingomonas sp. NFR04]SFJ84557.1 Anti-sigma-K factor RskA [Sphingomonas sp. NFR04]
MAEPLRPEDEDIVLAAELALGLLDGEDLAVARRRQLADPVFAAAVARWVLDFAPLALGGVDAPVSAGLWRRIEARLPGGDHGSVVALRRWRATAIAASAAAAVLLAILLLRPVPQPVVLPPPPVVVAQITGTAGAAFAARYDAAQGMLHVRTEALPASRQAPELWVIPAGGKPVSLGLVAPHGSRDVTVAPATRALLAEGATLAVTLEDAATAPHVAPTSTPVAAGKITIL